MLGLEGAELSRHQQELEAALSSSSVLPDHHAMLGTAFTQFRSAETGILDLFLGLTKGLEVRVLYVLYLSFIVILWLE